MLPLLSLLLLLLLAVSQDVSGSPLSGPELIFKSNICPRIGYNSLYAAYELRLPLLLDTSRWGSEGRLSELRVSGSSVMQKSGLSVVASADGANGASVSLLCRSFSRCDALLTQAIADPLSVVSSLRFNAAGWNGRRRMSSGWTPAQLEAGAALVSKGCNTGWVLFQQRVDGSLSFKQNWDTYERGFGAPSGNYWMGLANLHRLLKGGSRYYPCHMRIEVTSIAGRKYWGEWTQFFVEGASSRYTIRVSSATTGSQIPSRAWTYVNGMRFTTYDRDNDAYRENCSRLFGYGGFWYRSCHYINLNGEYPNRGSPKNAVFSVVNFLDKRKYERMVKTRMLFKCSPAVQEAKSQ